MIVRSPPLRNTFLMGAYVFGIDVILGEGSSDEPAGVASFSAGRPSTVVSPVHGELVMLKRGLDRAGVAWARYAAVIFIFHGPVMLGRQGVALTGSTERVGAVASDWALAAGDRQRRR